MPNNAGNEILVTPLNRTLEAMRLDAVRESAAQLHERFSWCGLPYDDTLNRQYIDRAESMCLSKEGLFLSVLHRCRGIYLGEVGIDHIDEELGRINIFYWIRRSQQNLGYATAATRLLLQIACQRMPVRLAEISMETGNLISKRVAEKVGARFSHSVHYERGLTGRPIDAFSFHYHFDQQNREAENCIE